MKEIENKKWHKMENIAELVNYMNFLSYDDKKRFVNDTPYIVLNYARGYSEILDVKFGHSLESAKKNEAARNEINEMFLNRKKKEQQ